MRLDVEILGIEDGDTSTQRAPDIQVGGVDGAGELDEDELLRELEKELFPEPISEESEYIDSSDKSADEGLGPGGPGDGVEGGLIVAGPVVAADEGADIIPVAPKMKAKAKGKVKEKAKAKAKVHVAPAAPPAHHPTVTCNVRGDNLTLLKHDVHLKKMSIHCRHPQHTKLCRMQRTLLASASNDAGIIYHFLFSNMVFQFA